MARAARSEHPSAVRALARGVVKRCPRCGRGRLFTGWWAMRETCPRCGLPFERGEGYWLGAIAINLAVAELAFFATLLTGMAITWPDVPWLGLGLVCVAVNIVVPIVFYPFSKTIFVAIDLVLRHPAGGSR